MATPCTSSSRAARTTLSTLRSWPRWTTSAPWLCSSRRITLIAASCPSNRLAAVTNRTGWTGTCRSDGLPGMPLPGLRPTASPRPNLVGRPSISPDPAGVHRRPRALDGVSARRDGRSPCGGEEGAMAATRFTELIGCSVPVQQAPMEAVSTPALIAAVAEAGAVGTLGALGMTADQVVGAIEATRTRTSGVLSVNFQTERVDEEAVAAAAERVRLIDFF